MSITENTSQYYIGQEEEGDDFPDKRGGKYNGVYFFRDPSGNLIYTGTDGVEWREFKQEWKNQQESDLSEEEIVDEYEETIDDEIVVEEESEDFTEEEVEESFEATTIYSPSNAGEPLENPNIPADTNDGNDLNKLDFSSQYSSPNGSGNDQYSGTGGVNTFDFNPLLNAKPEIIERNVDEDGRIDWQGVAGENDNRHDHWVDAIGEDSITDFSGQGGDGDQINITGHTVVATVIEESDGQVVLGVYSDQGADGSRGNGAHDLDVLGTITVSHDGNFNFGSDVNVNSNNVFDGVREFA